jgi:hemerythrin superfamily protein
MDAIQLTKKDHRTVEDLFKRYKKLGPRAFVSKQRLARRMTKELSIHAAIEEQFLYPALQKAAGKRAVDEALSEHQEVKEALAQLDRMRPQDPHYDERVHQVMQNVTHHAKEEERDMLPKLRKALSRKELEHLGEQMKLAKRVAPTRPHPKAPNEPPGNVVAGLVAGPLDRVRDTLTRRPA